MLIQKIYIAFPTLFTSMNINMLSLRIYINIFLNVKKIVTINFSFPLNYLPSFIYYIQVLLQAKSCSYNIPDIREKKMHYRKFVYSNSKTRIFLAKQKMIILILSFYIYIILLFSCSKYTEKVWIKSLIYIYYV